MNGQIPRCNSAFKGGGEAMQGKYSKWGTRSVYFGKHCSNCYSVLAIKVSAAFFRETTFSKMANSRLLLTDTLLRRISILVVQLFLQTGQWR